MRRRPLPCRPPPPLTPDACSPGPSRDAAPLRPGPLHGPGPAAFAEAHWSRTPLLTRAKELPQGSFDDLLSVADVDELVADRALRTPFFRTVREGGGLPTPVRTVTAGNRRIGDLVDGDALRAQHADGATLVLQSVHRLHPPVARFCRPAGGRARPRDAVQRVHHAGRRRAGLRLPPRHPRRLRAAGQRAQALDRARAGAAACRSPSQPQAGGHLVPDGAEPLLDVELEAGDCLYLPRGYVHAALTTDEHSVHLTVGVLSTTWYDVLGRRRRPWPPGEEAFRDALPRAPGAARSTTVPALLQRAAAVARGAAGRAGAGPARPAPLARAVPPEPVPLLAQAAALAQLGPATALAPAPRAAGRASVEGERAVLRLPGAHRRAARLDAPTPCGRRSPGRAPSPTSPWAGSTEADAQVLARRMLREGVAVAGADAGDRTVRWCAQRTRGAPRPRASATRPSLATGQPGRALAARRAHRRRGPESVPSGRMPVEAARALARTAAARRARLRSSARRRQRCRGPGRWVYAVDSRPGAERRAAPATSRSTTSCRRSVPPYDGVAAAGTRLAEPLLLVCTHGRHDRAARCAAAGGRRARRATPGDDLGVQPRRRRPVRGEPARAAGRPLLRAGRGRRGGGARRGARGGRPRRRPAAGAQQPVAAGAGRAALRPRPAGARRRDYLPRCSGRAPDRTVRLRQRRAAAAGRGRRAYDRRGHGAVRHARSPAGRASPSGRRCSGWVELQDQASESPAAVEDRVLSRRLAQHGDELAAPPCCGGPARAGRARAAR